MSEDTSQQAQQSADEKPPKGVQPVKILRVKSNLPKRPDGGAPVALFEKDQRHPRNGEAYVAGDIVAEVANTPAVVAALREDRIVETDEPVTDMQPPNLNLQQTVVTQTAIAPQPPPAQTSTSTSGAGDKTTARDKTK